MSIALVLDVAASVGRGGVVLGSRADGLTLDRLRHLSRGGAAALTSARCGTAVYLGLNEPAFPVVVFAAAQAGVPVAPLNYRLAPAELGRLLARLERPFVVCDPAFAAIVAGLGVPYRVVPEWLAACEERGAPDGEAVAPPGTDAAALLFTSGTTGEPKCVRLSHENLSAYVFGTVDPGSAGENDCALVSVPPYHVAGVGTVLTNLLSGRRLLYLPSFDPARWLSLVRAERVTFAMVVPTMLARIVAELETERAELPSLRSIAYGGARMPRPLLERALALLPRVDFVNAYGLTETSSTISLLTPADHREAFASPVPEVRQRLSSVGRLIPGVQGQIRDGEGRVLPHGAEGGLWVRGPQVSGHYVGAGPVLDTRGWFDTRDRARFDADGYLFLGGRTDDVIIRGGENVAPAEIEDVLLTCPEVADAVVFGVPDEVWGERIVAVVVPWSRPGPDPESLKAFVRAELRGPKTPEQILYRDELPRTDTGKVLRRVLRHEVADAGRPAGSGPA